MTDFVKKTKLTELENNISDVSSLATITTLTGVENKIPSVNNLIKKTIQKSVKLKKRLLIIIMTNISLLQSLIL